MTEVKELFLTKNKEITISCCHWDVVSSFTSAGCADDYMVLVFERLLI